MANPGEIIDTVVHDMYPNIGDVERLSAQDTTFYQHLTRGKSQGAKSNYDYSIRGSRALAANREDANFQANLAGGSGRALVGQWQNVLNGDYKGTVNIRDKDIAETEASSDASFIRSKAHEIKTLNEESIERLETYLIQDTKALGSAATSGIHDTNGTCTVENPEDIYNFSKGMVLICSTGATSSDETLTGVAYVISVDTEGGTFTVSTSEGGSGGAPAAWETANDSLQVFFFNYGDFPGTDAGSTGSTTGTLIIDSVLDWITSTSTPTPQTRYSVDRHTDSRLTGTRLRSALITGSIETRAENLATELYTISKHARGHKAFVHPYQFARLGQILRSRGITPVNKTGSNSMGEFGYTALEFMGQGGMIEFISVPKMSQTLLLMCNMERVFFNAIGEVPNVIGQDGLRFLRKTDTDEYQYKITIYAHLAVPEPGFHGRVPLPAISS